MAKGLPLSSDSSSANSFEVLLDQVGELPQHAAAFGGRHARPGAFVECPARGAHGAVDVFGFGFGHMGDDVAGGGVVDGEGLAGGRGDKTAIDEHAVIFLDKVGGAAADAGVDGDGSHRF